MTSDNSVARQTLRWPDTASELLPGTLAIGRDDYRAALDRIADGAHRVAFAAFRPLLPHFTEPKVRDVYFDHPGKSRYLITLPPILVPGRGSKLYLDAATGTVWLNPKFNPGFKPFLLDYSAWSEAFAARNWPDALLGPDLRRDVVLFCLTQLSRLDEDPMGGKVVVAGLKRPLKEFTGHADATSAMPDLGREIGHVVSSPAEVAELYREWRQPNVVRNCFHCGGWFTAATGACACCGDRLPAGTSPPTWLGGWEIPLPAAVFRAFEQQHGHHFALRPQELVDRLRHAAAMRVGLAVLEQLRAARDGFLGLFPDRKLAQLVRDQLPSLDELLRRPQGRGRRQQRPLEFLPDSDERTIEP